MTNGIQHLQIPDFRYYVILFYSEQLSVSKIIENVRKKISDIEYKKIELKKLATFPYKHYDTLGVIGIHLGEIDTTQDYKPINVFERSQIIHKNLSMLSEEVHGMFF